jgi:hypothetical protein
MMKCVAESEDVCRHLVCPRHRRRLAFCPWAANGHEAKPVSAFPSDKAPAVRARSAALQINPKASEP